MPIQPSENPIYVLPQKKSRALIPKILSLLVLSVLFYLGILVNVSLLDLTARQDTVIKIVSLLILVLINIIGVYLAIHRSAPYRFYSAFIVHNGKSHAYSAIQNTSPHHDFWDKRFKTYSIHLGDDFVLRNIPSEIALENYLQQLIHYARNQVS